MLAFVKLRKERVNSRVRTGPLNVPAKIQVQAVVDNVELIRDWQVSVPCCSNNLLCVLPWLFSICRVTESVVGTHYSINSNGRRFTETGFK